MAIFNWNAIYLGNAADMDPDEFNPAAENAGSLLGTYGSVEDPLKNNKVSVSANDADNSGQIEGNDPSEPLTIDGVSKVMDSVVQYQATITYMDGTTATITAIVMQTTDGDLYLAPEIADNADKAAMEAGPIRSLTLNSVDQDTGVLGAQRQQTDFVCFVEGTLIDIPGGTARIEDLRAGDKIRTTTGRHRIIKWIGSKHISAIAQLSDPTLRPVVVSPNALGPDKPSQPLRLSRQHRIMLSSPIAKRMFGEEEVLVAVHKLLSFPGFSPAPASSDFRYFHIGLSSHDVIVANGAPAETLYLGPEAKRLLRETPGLTLSIADETFLPPIPARPIASGPKLKRFLERLHEKCERQGLCLGGKPRGAHLPDGLEPVQR